MFAAAWEMSWGTRWASNYMNKTLRWCHQHLPPALPVQLGQWQLFLCPPFLIISSAMLRPFVLALPPPEPTLCVSVPLLTGAERPHLGSP